MTEQVKAASDELVEDLLWRFGEAEFDERAGVLKLAGEEIELEPRPLEVLAYLLRHAGEVVTKEELLQAIWHRSPELISDKVLTNAIGKLRRELKDEQEALIVTLPRRGYRLSVPVSRVVVGRRVVPKLDFKPGDKVPRREQWRLVKSIDVSLKSEVWLAEHEKTRARRVFKFSADGARLSALKREVTLSRVLQESLGERPEFVPVLEWNFEEAPYFIECDDGGLDWLHWAEAQGGLAAVPLALRLALFVQAAEAIGAAHGVGVLHKDIKPANLLIAPKSGGDWQVRVTDFGSGRLLEPGRLEELGITRLGFTQTQAVSGDSLTGTPLYLAPELLAGQSPTQASDVYALGVLLYQLVAADFRKPLSAGWEREVEDELLREDIALAAAGDAGLRLDSARALAQQVARLPQRRQERAAAQRRQADAEMARQALARARQRRPWVLAAGAALVAGLAVSLSLLWQVSKARNETQTQAEISRAVNQFLDEELLAQANPLISGKTEVTIAEAARASRQSLARRFGAQPLIEARLHQTLGSVFLQLGSFPDAVKELETAWTLLGQHRGAEAAETMIACYELAQAHARGSEQAIAKAQMARCPQPADDGSSQSAEALFLRENVLGQMAMLDYQSDEAIQYYRQAIALAGRLPQQAAGRALTARQNLGSAYSFAGRGPEAQAVLQPLIEELEPVYGSEHYRTLDARTTLAQSLMLQDRFAEALPVYQAVIPALQNRLGASHQTTLQTRGELGFVLAQLERPKEALPILKSTIDELSRTLGENHLLTQVNVANLASALAVNGELDEALRQQEQVCKTFAKLLGADHPLTKVMQYNRADLLLLQRRPDDAELALKDVTADALQLGSPARDWTARLELDRARILWLKGREQEARELLGRASSSINRDSADSRRLLRETERLIGLKAA